MHITLRYLVSGDAKITFGSSYRVNLWKYLDNSDGERLFESAYNPPAVEGGGLPF